MLPLASVTYAYGQKDYYPHKKVITETDLRDLVSNADFYECLRGFMDGEWNFASSIFKKTIAIAKGNCY